jgi:hypothetical protein
MPRRLSSERSVFAEMTFHFCASPMILASSVLPVSAAKPVESFAVTVSAMLSHCATMPAPHRNHFRLPAPASIALCARELSTPAAVAVTPAPWQLAEPSSTRSGPGQVRVEPGPLRPTAL